jgi:hypothetical protein
MKKVARIHLNERIALSRPAGHECGALMATQNDDNEKRAEVAKIWSKLFKAKIKSDRF